MGRTALALFAVFAVGCTTPAQEGPVDSGQVTYHAGDSCVTYFGGAQGALCDGETMLECRANHYAGIPCRGAQGCSVTTESVVLCDNLTGVLSGDLCPSSQEAQALCSDDAGTYFVCSDGGFVQGNHCDGGCAVSGGNVYCNP